MGQHFDGSGFIQDFFWNSSIYFRSDIADIMIQMIDEDKDYRLRGL